MQFVFPIEFPKFIDITVTKVNPKKIPTRVPRRSKLSTKYALTRTQKQSGKKRNEKKKNEKKTPRRVAGRALQPFAEVIQRDKRALPRNLSYGLIDPERSGGERAQ